jgi:hypothetical protein
MPSLLRASCRHTPACDREVPIIAAISRSDLVSRIPTGLQYAIETRNGNCPNATYLGLVNQHDLWPVLLQGYWMPPVVGVCQAHRDLLSRASGTVMRLHGPDREGTRKETGDDWSRIAVPRDDELRGTVGVVRELLDAGVDVNLNVNNHYEDSAPLTIERIEALLRGDQALA